MRVRETADEGSCIPSEFSCADKSACLERHLVCNGHPDCDDSSDELPDCSEFIYLSKDVLIIKLYLATTPCI